MLWLIAGNAAVLAPAPRTAQAHAVIRVERGAAANLAEWQRQSTTQRREIIAYDGHGRPILVRLFEYQ